MKYVMIAWLIIIVLVLYGGYQSTQNLQETEMAFQLDKVKENRKFEPPEEDSLEVSYAKFRDAIFDYQFQKNLDVEYDKKTRIYNWETNRLEWFRRIRGVVIRIEMSDYDKADQIEQMVEDVLSIAEEHLDPGFNRIRVDIIDDNKIDSNERLIKTYTYNRPNG